MEMFVVVVEGSAERKRIYCIYDLIIDGKMKDSNFIERLFDLRFKDKKIIYEALLKYKCSLSSSYFKIDNPKEINDEIFRNDLEKLLKMFRELKEKFQDKAFDEKREKALRILENDLYQMSRLMDKARRYVFSDYQKREEVWDIPGKTLGPKFTISMYERLENLTIKYFESKASLDKISEMIYNKSEKVKDYGLDRLCREEGQNIANILGQPDSLPHWRYTNLGNYQVEKYQEYQNRLKILEDKFNSIIESIENDISNCKRIETELILCKKIARCKKMKGELRDFLTLSYKALDRYICANSRSLKPMMIDSITLDPFMRNLFTERHCALLEEYMAKYDQASPKCAKSCGQTNLERIREILNLKPQDDLNEQNKLCKLSVEPMR